jgi:hypothetical protein
MPSRRRGGGLTVNHQHLQLRQRRHGGSAYHIRFIFVSLPQCRGWPRTLLNAGTSLDGWNARSVSGRTDEPVDALRSTFSTEK